MHADRGHRIDEIDLDTCAVEHATSLGGDMAIGRGLLSLLTLRNLAFRHLAQNKKTQTVQYLSTHPSERN